MLEFTWQMTNGLWGLSKKVIAVMAIGYGISIIAFSHLVSEYTDQLYRAVQDYYFVIFVVMVLVILYMGYYTLREWRIHRKNQVKTSGIALIVPFFMALIVPHTCCIYPVVATIISSSSAMGALGIFIGHYVSVLLAVIISVSYIASGAVVRVVKMPYSVSFGNFMLYVGLFFLAITIIIFSGSVLASEVSPISISSETVYFASIGLIGLVIMGIFTSRRFSLVNEK